MQLYGGGLVEFIINCDIKYGWVRTMKMRKQIIKMGGTPYENG
jgi:hypothetical protein